MKEENMAAVSGLASRFWFIVFVSSYVVSQQAASETLANLPSPLVNLTVNLKKLEMTWDNTANVTTYICCMSSVGVDPNPIPMCTRGEKSCSFMNSLVKPIHQGALFEVKTEYNNKPFSEKYLFTPEGMNGTSAENFSCTVYNVSSMKCTWKAGWNASQDTQYFLYIKYWGEDNERECHNYIKNTLGRHVGCNFHNVTIAERKVYFLVNGSSNETVIRFYDEYINLYEIEILTSPLNISANCTKPPCVIKWKKPQRSLAVPKHCFQFEIDIKEAKDNHNMEDGIHRVKEYTYTFQDFNVKTKYILKIRARGNYCLVSNNWGEWSTPIEFGNEDDEFAPLVRDLLLITFGTITIALLLIFLCKRYMLPKIFPPVPQPKDKFNEILGKTDKNVANECVNLHLRKEETEEIITSVKEMT